MFCVRRDFRLYTALQVAATGAAELCNKAFVKLRKLIALFIYKYVIIFFSIAFTFALYKIILFKNLAGSRRYPHKGVRILRQEVKLAGSFKDIYAFFGIFGELLSYYLCH